MQAGPVSIHAAAVAGDNRVHPIVVNVAVEHFAPAPAKIAFAGDPLFVGPAPLAQPLCVVMQTAAAIAQFLERTKRPSAYAGKIAAAIASSGSLVRTSRQSESPEISALRSVWRPALAGPRGRSWRSRPRDRPLPGAHAPYLFGSTSRRDPGTPDRLP